MEKIETSDEAYEKLLDLGKKHNSFNEWNKLQISDEIKLYDRTFEDLNLSYFNLSKITLIDCKFKNVNLSNSIFKYTEVKESTFDNVSLLNSNLDNTNLNKSNFNNVNLSQAKCTDSNLYKAHLNDVNLHFTIFDHSNFQINNLTKAITDGASFVNANVKQDAIYVKMDNAIFTKKIPIWKCISSDLNIIFQKILKLFIKDKITSP